jgi:hypothetical protein
VLLTSASKELAHHTKGSIMQFRTLKTATAILAATAGVSAFAGSAQAAVVDNYPFYMNSDSEVTFSGGNVKYDWSHSTVSAQVTGTLNVVNGDDASFRVRVDSYDIHNNLLGASAYDTANPDGHHLHTDKATSFPVDMSATAAPSIAYLKVALEKKSANTWKTRSYYNVTLLLHPDDVKILGTGIDVGGNGFDRAKHEPTNSASVSWSIGSDGKLKATYHGWLHLDHGFSPLYGRVVIRALNAAGKALDTAEGASWQPITLAYESHEETLSVESADATRLQVAMQTAAGTDPVTGDLAWRDAGTQTVSVAE